MQGIKKESAASYINNSIVRRLQGRERKPLTPSQTLSNQYITILRGKSQLIFTYKIKLKVHFQKDGHGMKVLLICILIGLGLDIVCNIISSVLTKKEECYTRELLEELKNEKDGNGQ